MCEAICSGRREAFRVMLMADHYSRSEAQIDALLDEWFAHPNNNYIRKILK